MNSEYMVMSTSNHAASVKMIAEQVSKGRVVYQEVEISNKPWFAPESVPSPNFAGLDHVFVVVRPKHRKVYQMQTETMQLINSNAYSTSKGMVIKTEFEEVSDVHVVKKVNEQEPNKEFRFFFQPRFARSEVPAYESKVDVETVFLTFTADEISNIHKNVGQIIGYKDSRIVNFTIVLVVSDDVSLGDLTATDSMPIPHAGDCPNIMKIASEKFNVEFCGEILAPRRRVRVFGAGDDDESPHKRSKTEYMG